jgi:hypothetical protein
MLTGDRRPLSVTRPVALLVAVGARAAVTPGRLRGDEGAQALPVRHTGTCVTPVKIDVSAKRSTERCVEQRGLAVGHVTSGISTSHPVRDLHLAGEPQYVDTSHIDAQQVSKKRLVPGPRTLSKHRGTTGKFMAYASSKIGRVLVTEWGLFDVR